ncbi:MAG: hypothetical protein LBT30_04135 [Clostridiales bacterium]|jgi:hypothetical protein|nr:hypothetical protein [Clostridiales bacterium]
MADFHLVRIENDLYDIAARLREIDGEYYPVFNKKCRRFEIHRGSGSDTLACIPPFDRLDTRTLEYVRRTRRENAAALMEEIERDNIKAAEERQKRLTEDTLKKAADVAEHLYNGQG